MNILVLLQRLEAKGVPLRFAETGSRIVAYPENYDFPQTSNPEYSWYIIGCVVEHMEAQHFKFVMLGGGLHEAMFAQGDALKIDFVGGDTLLEAVLKAATKALS